MYIISRNGVYYTLGLDKLCDTYNLLRVNKSARNIAFHLVCVQNLGWCRQFLLGGLFNLIFMITHTEGK